jgi:hypothetical protein
MRPRVVNGDGVRHVARREATGRVIPRGRRRVDAPLARLEAGAACSVGVGIGEGPAALSWPPVFGAGWAGTDRVSLGCVLN